MKPQHNMFPFFWEARRVFLAAEVPQPKFSRYVTDIDDDKFKKETWIHQDLQKLKEEIQNDIKNRNGTLDKLSR